MKNIKTVIAAIISMVFLAACGGGTTPPEDNQAPTVSSIEINGSMLEGEPVNFKAVASDADGQVVNYQWSGDVSANTAVTSKAFSAGTYTATVTVTDDDGATASASKTFTVTAIPIEITTAVKMLVGVDIGPGEKAAFIGGRMQKTTQECPGDDTGVWQSELERHFDYMINPNTGEHMIALCSDSPFKIKNGSSVYGDYTIFILSEDKKTISIYAAGIKDGSRIGFIGGTLGLAWSQSDQDTVQDHNGNSYDITREKIGDITVFKSFFDGTLESESNSTTSRGVVSYKEY